MTMLSRHLEKQLVDSHAECKFLCICRCVCVARSSECTGLCVCLCVCSWSDDGIKSSSRATAGWLTCRGGNAATSRGDVDWRITDRSTTTCRYHAQSLMQGTVCVLMCLSVCLSLCLSVSLCLCVLRRVESQTTARQHAANMHSLSCKVMSVSRCVSLSVCLSVYVCVYYVLWNDRPAAWQHADTMHSLSCKVLCVSRCVCLSIYLCVLCRVELQTTACQQANVTMSLCHVDVCQYSVVKHIASL